MRSSTDSELEDGGELGKERALQKLRKDGRLSQGGGVGAESGGGVMNLAKVTTSNISLAKVITVRREVN